MYRKACHCFQKAGSLQLKWASHRPVSRSQKLLPNRQARTLKPSLILGMWSRFQKVQDESLVSENFYVGMKSRDHKDIPT